MVVINGLRGPYLPIRIDGLQVELDSFADLQSRCRGGGERFDSMASDRSNKCNQADGKIPAIPSVEISWLNKMNKREMVKRGISLKGTPLIPEL